MPSTHYADFNQSSAKFLYFLYSLYYPMRNSKCKVCTKGYTYMKALKSLNQLPPSIYFLSVKGSCGDGTYPFSMISINPNNPPQ
jgi:hypothetical protein